MINKKNEIILNDLKMLLQLLNSAAAVVESLKISLAESLGEESFEFDNSLKALAAELNLLANTIDLSIEIAEKREQLLTTNGGASNE